MNQPDVPETYEEYLRRMDAQAARDRDRFFGHDSHDDSPLFDARNGELTERESGLIVVASLDNVHPDFFVTMEGKPLPFTVRHFQAANGDCVMVPIDRRLLP